MRLAGFCLIGFLISCNVTNDTASNPNPQNNIVSIVDMLRSRAGVMVQGEGEEARIRVRNGGQSFLGDSEPLFVINGQPISGGIVDVINLVHPLEVKDIRVLKSAGEVAGYGVRGGNGVIEIITN